MNRLGICDVVIRNRAMTGIEMESDAPLPCHSHDTNCVFRIGVNLRLKYGVHGVGLRVEAGWWVVPVPHEFRVVNNHHRRFERHRGGAKSVCSEVKREERSMARTRSDRGGGEADASRGARTLYVYLVA